MKRKVAILILMLSVLVTGCSGQPDGSFSTEDISDVEDETAKTEETVDGTDMFTDRDYNMDYDESKSAHIELTGTSAVCDSDAVQISGGTITIKDEGTYIFTGTLDNGMIIVDAGEDDKPQLVFSGVTINSKTSAPVYILEADKVVITLTEGTDNSLINGGEFVGIDENNIDGTIFSKQDLTFNGTGSITISSPAGHGIVCKDDLVFTGGTYTINSSSHGVDANDSVRLVNAAITINSGKDGIHVENTDDTSKGFFYVAGGTFDISAEGDGISAGAYIQIEDGSFDIVSGGGSENAEQQSSDSWGGFMGGKRGHSSSHETQIQVEEDDSSTSIKGIKSTGNLVINSGSFTINSADDAIHSNASVLINGGKFTIASGDDGFHADATLVVNDGTIEIGESYEGLEGLYVEIAGGNIALVASDDGVNAAGGTDSSGLGGPRGNDKFGGSSSNGSIIISGGNLQIEASGDGIDANGTLTISGGYTVVSGPMRGDTATLDYDSSGEITGGTFIGTGASGMAQSFSDSKQGVIAVNAGSQSAGTSITVTDSKGNTIISYVPQLSYEVVILSSPDIVKGEMYTITVGTASGEFQAS